MFPETCQATCLSSLPVPLGPEGRLTTLQGAPVPIDPTTESFSNTNVQMLQEQMPYAAYGNLACDFGNTGPELVPALGQPHHNPNTIIDCFGWNDNADGFINLPGWMIGDNPHSAWVNPPSFHGNEITEGGDTNTGNVLACDRLNIATSSLRLRGVRSPPQTYEADVVKLHNRLIQEGADMMTAMFLLYVIFAEGVTIDALMAPIQAREVLRTCDGANKMWKMLLETREVIPGKKKYHCLLCPVGNRAEYRHDHDAVRHFNRDHFGFSFPCEFW